MFLIIFEIAVTMFLSLWNGLLFMILVTKLYKTKSEDRYFSKKIIFSALINFIGWCICYMIHAIIRFDKLLNMDINESLITIMYCIFTVFYSISFVSSYVFVISMIYAVFDGSQFAMTKCKLYSHFSLSAILLTLCASGTFFVYIIPNRLGPILHFVLYLLYIIGLCSLYYLLNMNLIKMVMLANDRSKIHVFNAAQSSFMLTITKLSVLQGIFTFTAIFYLLITILHHVVFNNTISGIIEWFCYLLTVIIGTLSIFLAFKMNNTEYNFICKPCNKCCAKCCNSIVKWLYLTNTMKTEIRTIRSRTLSVPSKSVTTQSTFHKNGEGVGTMTRDLDLSSCPKPITSNITTTTTIQLSPIKEAIDNAIDIDLERKNRLNLDDDYLPNYSTKITPAPSLEEVKVDTMNNCNNNKTEHVLNDMEQEIMESPKTPLMFNKEAMNANSVYNLQPIFKSNEKQ